MNYADLQYLTIQLPEAVLKERWSGNFQKAREAINHLMAQEGIEYPLRCRLEFELKNLDYIEELYTVSEDEALEIMRRRIPDMTAEELRQLRFEDKADWMYIDGKVKYIDCFSDTLYKVYPEIWERTEEGDLSDYSVLENLVQDLEDGQDMEAHIHIRQDFSIADEAVEEGKTLSVHMPVPKERDGIENLKILSVNPSCKYTAADDAPQPTVYFEEKAEKGQVFSVEYEFDHKIKYRDFSKADLQKISEAEIPEEEKKYLEEQLPHIYFTPYLRDLALRLAEGETNPLLVARKFYDYITTQTDYRFVRYYSCIDNLSEYCALNKRGDCGVQALLFITLCRIAGIPAKWQSGLDAKPGDVGEHDWAMFYVPSMGWAYADLSYGGSSYIRGAYKRWNFFFGNVDPYRIPINSGFQKEFDPPKKHWRIDPYDNQCGEAEYEDKGIKPKDMRYKYNEIDIHLVK